MKNFKEKSLILVLILAIVCLLPLCSFATFSAKPVITPDKTTVNAGDTITCTIKFSDIVDVGSGINALRRIYII